MLTYRNISKTLTAVLALSLLTTGCLNDRSLKNDKANLQKKLKAEKNRTADQKQKISDLENKITTLEADNMTLSQLKEEIEKNQASLVDLNDLLNSTKTELAAAQKELADAKTETSAIRTDAEQRMSAAMILKAQLESLKTQLDARNARLDVAIADWKAIYGQARLGKAFERLMSLEKMDHLLTFQVSIIGVNVGIESALALRKISLAMQNSESNKYKTDFKISPAQETLWKNEAALNAAKKTTATVGNKIDAAITRERYNIDDSYLVSATGNSLSAMRNAITALDDSSSIIYVVVRPVEKVIANMQIQVRGTRGEYAVGTEQTLMTANLKSVVLSDMSALSNADITKTYEAILSSKACKTLGADCLTELSKQGYLDVSSAYEQTSFGIGSGYMNYNPAMPTPSKITVKEKLTTLLTASADQTLKDLVKVEQGYTSSGLFGGSKMALDDNMQPYEVKEAAATERRFIVTQIAIQYKVQIVEDIPSTGLVAIDVANMNDLKSSAVRSKGSVTIELPITNIAESKVNIRDRFDGQPTIGAIKTAKEQTKERLSEMIVTLNNLKQSLNK